MRVLKQYEPKGGNPAKIVGLADANECLRALEAVLDILILLCAHSDLFRHLLSALFLHDVLIFSQNMRKRWMKTGFQSRRMRRNRNG